MTCKGCSTCRNQLTPEEEFPCKECCAGEDLWEPNERRTRVNYKWCYNCTEHVEVSDRGILQCPNCGGDLTINLFTQHDVDIYKKLTGE